MVAGEGMTPRGRLSRRRLWIGVLLLAPCAVLAPLAGAATEDSEAAHGASELTRTQATELVQKRYAARVVRASSSDEGGRRVYVFKLLSAGGKVWFVRIDARSGAEMP